MTLPPGDQPPRVVEPGEEALDDPSTFVAAQYPPVLRRGPDAMMTVRRDQLDPELGPERRIEWIAVVGAVADQARRVRGDESVFKRRGDEPNFMW